MITVKISIFAFILVFIILGTASVYAAVSPPAPELRSPSDGALLTIEQITFKWNTIPHDSGYYWFAWSRAENPDWWFGPDNNRVQGTEYTLSKEYVRDMMVYNGNSDTFYWHVIAEVSCVYYFPESWSPYSDAWSFNVLKWPAAWIDENYWECYIHDYDDTVKSIDGQKYSSLLSYGSPDTGWWDSVGNDKVPVTVSTSVHLCWTDRSFDERQKNVTFADYYRVQIATSSSFDDIIIDSTSETISYDTPELSAGAYYWRVKSETHGGLVTDWNWPRKFIIATAPTSISCAVSSSSVAVGSTATVSGSIVPACSGSTVTISYMTGGYVYDGPWSVLDTVTSGVDGSFSYSWTPSSPELYSIIAAWEGDSSHGGATSDAVDVTVKIPFTVTCSVSPSEVTIGGSVTVSGSVSPAVSYATVELTYEKPDATTFMRTTTTESDGAYSDSYKPDVAGSWSVSVLVEEAESASVDFVVNPQSGLIPGYPPIALLLGVVIVLWLWRRCG